MELKVSQRTTAAASVRTVELAPRVLGRLGDPSSGPHLIVLGAVHGNESAGYEAMRRLLSRFETARADLRGSLTGLVGNRQALAAGVRFLEEDLNRLWLPGIETRFEAEAELSADMSEARDLYGAIEGVLAAARGPVYALDIHSTSGPGPAFVVLDDSLPNREYALELEVPMVLGIEEELEGTLLDFLNLRGVRTAGFEAGQHTDPESVERAEAAIWVAMRASGVLGRNYESEVDNASRMLITAGHGLSSLFEVRYRHEIKPNSGFRMRPGLEGFVPVAGGDVVAEEGGEPVRAPCDGMLLMPLYQAQGEDGYFIIQPVKSVWLSISARMRRLGPERFVHWLPGVQRIDAAGQELKVDLRVARWLPLDFFHLLGFRRIGQVGRYLYLRRRPDDGVGGGAAGLASA